MRIPAKTGRASSACSAPPEQSRCRKADTRYALVSAVARVSEKITYATARGNKCTTGCMAHDQHAIPDKVRLDGPVIKVSTIDPVSRRAKLHSTDTYTTLCSVGDWGGRRRLQRGEQDAGGRHRGCGSMGCEHRFPGQPSNPRRMYGIRYTPLLIS